MAVKRKSLWSAENLAITVAIIALFLTLPVAVFVAASRKPIGLRSRAAPALPTCAPATENADCLRTQFCNTALIPPRCAEKFGGGKYCRRNKQCISGICQTNTNTCAY